MLITPRNTALVLTDPQNDFLSHEGVTWEVVGASVQTSCCDDPRDADWGRLPGAEPPLRWWLPAVVACSPRWRCRSSSCWSCVRLGLATTRTRPSSATACSWTGRSCPTERAVWGSAAGRSWSCPTGS